MHSLSVLLKVKQHGEGHNVDKLVRNFSIEDLVQGLESGLVQGLRMVQGVMQKRKLGHSQKLVQGLVQTIALRQATRLELGRELKLELTQERRRELGRELLKELFLLQVQCLSLSLRQFRELGIGRKLGLHLMTLLPEDCGAEMGVIYRRIKKANASPWAIRLRLIEEFMILLWGFVQVKIDNLRLPRSNRSIDD